MTVSEEKPTLPSSEKRAISHKMLWYMFTEVLYMALRHVTGVVSFKKFMTRSPCCVVPRRSNKSEHYTRRGAYAIESVSISIGNGRLSLALNYCVIMFRALEMFLNIPATYRVPQYTNSEYYDTPRHLFRYFGGSPRVKQVLENDIDDPDNIQYFRDHVWKGSIGNGFLDLNADPDRFGGYGMPSEQSNEMAFARRHLVLQDLLIVAPIALRLFRHGMHKELLNSGEVTDLEVCIRKELDSSRLVDSVVDGGYTLYVNDLETNKLSVHVPRSSVLIPRSNPFIPLTAAHRTNASLGMKMFSSHLYPFCTGFQTATLQVRQDGRKLGPLMKKVKVYQTTRHMNSNRGETAYSSPLWYELINKLRSSMSVYASFVAQLQSEKDGMRKSSTKQLKEDRFFEICF
ncbi:hypothetical protein BWQ96_09565 [Gracilariopsis chorda]|uniref:Uncharacterized protein n=1 Tax=Gracilariopsis chorda TaxID=448386 RepID=A0A2V3IFA4_9FLOR|nr:hypothetical protein BWQ96_09565 [Gracilariopsis chorda]|eukprot:PXF40732.1 hypothetical protein BWQ96_09565 [Gracilariopsis chorda]